jgi:SAM-dependent methyltransferase
MMELEELRESIYDHPKYYDLVFGADCAAELRFIEQCNARFLEGRARRLFEPACGTGRLLFRLAKRGYQVGGLDLNAKAIAFCNARLERHGLSDRAWVADMARFEVNRPWDLAFNTINSFRHLASERAARDHFRSMAHAVRPGGLYLLGIHLRPTEANPSEGEAWAARRGNLAVNTSMWTLERDPRQRVERFAITFDVRTPLRQFRICDQLVLRSYTDAQLRQSLRAAGGWQVAETYDFHYQIDAPIDVDGTCEDVLYVLRRHD